RASSCRRYRRARPWSTTARSVTPAALCLAIGRVAVPPVAELPATRPPAIDGGPRLDRVRERHGLRPDRKSGIDATDPRAELGEFASVRGLVSVRSVDRRIDVEVAVA